MSRAEHRESAVISQKTAYSAWLLADLMRDCGDFESAKILQANATAYYAEARVHFSNHIHERLGS